MILKVILAGSAAIAALYRLYRAGAGLFSKTPADKVKQVLNETEAAIEKAKAKGDTSDLEDLFNR